MCKNVRGLDGGGKVRLNSPSMTAHRPPTQFPVHLLLSATFLLAASVALAADPATPPRDVSFGWPDPAIIQPQEKGPVYIFATGMGIPISRSDDLFHWQRIGRVFDRGAPDWAKKAVPGARGIWAPDIRRFNNLYYLYYAVSTFGSQRSVIGLAVNKRLDPADADYRWEDRGLVLESAPDKTDFNAIDPAMFVDRDNRPYLFWGSFWTGIKAAKLDPATGKLPDDAKITAIATRMPNTQPPAIEAPYVIAHGDYYYLFVSWDNCCEGERSTYKVIVGRSKSVLGPYLDHRGTSMAEGGGTLVLASYGKWRGPGHNSALCTAHGDWLVLAGYNVENLRRSRLLQIRRMYWPDDGWPVAGEVISAPEKFERRDEAPPSAAGAWTQWTDFGSEQTITLGAEGKSTARDREGVYRQKARSV